MNDHRPLVCPVLVARDDLLALADRRIAEVGAGRGHFLLLGGEAGVGKTRLLEAIERKLRVGRRTEIAVWASARTASGTAPTAPTSVLGAPER